MDDELETALEITSGGRLAYVHEARTLTYRTPEGTTIRLVTDAHDLRSLLQLVMLVDRPEPSSRPSLDVACGLLLTLLDARPDLAARSLPHVRAAVAPAILWSVDAREMANRQAGGSGPAARPRPAVPTVPTVPAVPAVAALPAPRPQAS